MTLHLRPIVTPRIKADTRALKAAREKAHRDLRNELAEEAISASMPRIFQRRQEVQTYLQQGGK